MFLCLFQQAAHEHTICIYIFTDYVYSSLSLSTGMRVTEWKQKQLESELVSLFTDISSLNLSITVFY